jgi:hypothetical protein
LQINTTFSKGVLFYPGISRDVIPQELQTENHQLLMNAAFVEGGLTLKFLVISSSKNYEYTVWSNFNEHRLPLMHSFLP